jgi:multidrug efflux pump subunit AcrB
MGIVGYMKVGKTAMPSAAMDIINVSVPYLGAGPREVEDRIVIRLEEAVFDIRGVKRLTGRASEGVGSVRIEINEGEDVESLLITKLKRVLMRLIHFQGFRKDRLYHVHLPKWIL